MSCPAVNHPCWNKLASGAIARLKTDHLGTQMLIKRMQVSPDPAPAKAKMLFEYFSKWQRALPDEIARLSTI